MMDFTKLKFACFGDSLTSDEVTGIGTAVCKKLGAELVGNFAHGNSTCSDWQSDGVNITPLCIDIPFDACAPVNCLSNQVFGLLAHTTKEGCNVSWNHPIDGSFSVPIKGKGFTDDAPDIIYIAISANDGKASDNESPVTPVVDDTDAAYLVRYSQLSRLTIASALRWAIETLQSAYPGAFIFVASSMQANSGILHTAFDFDVLLKKREIIKKVCLYSSVYFVDIFGESGFSRLFAKAGGDAIGIHPQEFWKNRIANYVVHEIKTHYYDMDKV